MQRKRVISAFGGLAFCGIVAGLIGFFIIAPLNAWKTRGLEARAQTLSEIQRTQATIDRLKQQSSRIAQNDEGDFLWRAEQIGAVTAQIQTALSASAVSSGISLRSITPLKTKRLASVDAAGFRLEFEATLDQVSGFLQQIEYSSPVLLVEKASLRQLSRPASNQTQPVLNAQLELIAPIHLEEAVAE
ncbi:type II secretion system protein GspM [Ruegeria sp.]|uniref:type II secretion system protein GspM n=1 Tax=Ruegeria sp. TaxID=1879320 RepID=UPI0023154912|nr:type II secretion system protein GspM [Ruegeria sp.]MDA7966147.1 type II secretion system protein GspM [Ruegeria sp.]